MNAIATMPRIATHNGTLTLENPATGNHRTFRIKSMPEDSRFAPGKRVVSLLTGPDNTRDYTGFGFVNPDGTITVWTKYKEGVHATFAKMLTAPEPWEARGVIYHWDDVKCRRCNRKLTTPESVTSGIGPDCAGRV